MKHGAKSTKGIGGLIAMIFILSALVIAFIVLTFHLQQQEEIWQTYQKNLEQEMKSIAITKSVNAIWQFENPSTLIINITNGYVEPIRITGLVIYYQNGSYQLLKGKLNEATAKLIRDSTVTTIDSLPTWLTPGETLQITLNTNEEPASITCSVASVTALASAIARKYTPTNITITPTYQVELIPLIAREGTVTALGHTAKSIDLWVKDAKAPVNSSVTGDASALNASDGYYTVTSKTLNPNWLPGWKYRRPISITNSLSRPLQNYQVKIVLNASNFDSWNKVSLDKNDLPIIRFTYSTNTTLLPYWVQKWDEENQKAIIWVKVNLTASGTTTIYMYYGNLTPASSQSNLISVMEKLPASDGPGYTIQYEEWIMPENMFQPTLGEAQGWHGDDYAYRYELPFTFPYYDMNVSQIWIHNNGFLYIGNEPFYVDIKNLLDGPKAIYGNATYFTSTQNPTYRSSSGDGGDDLYQHPMIAPFWADLVTVSYNYINLWTPPVAIYRNIYIDPEYNDEYGRGVYVRWYTWFLDYYFLWWSQSFPHGNGEQNFAVVLYDNGLIRFDYGVINGESTRDYDDTQVVGVSYGDGIHYTVSSYDHDTLQRYPSNEESVMFWPRKVADDEVRVNVSDSEEVLVCKCCVEVVLDSVSSNVVGFDLTFRLKFNVSNVRVNVSLYNGSDWVFVRSVSVASANSPGQYIVNVVDGRYVVDGEVRVLFSVLEDEPFEMAIDYVHGDAYLPQAGLNVVYIGVGGTNKILIYNITSGEISSNVITVEYNGLPIIFNGSTSMDFDPLNLSLWIVSGRYIYRYDIVANETYLYGSLTSSVGPGCAVEYLKDLNYLVIFFGNGTNSYCAIIDLLNKGTRNNSAISLGNYSVTANDGRYIYIVNDSAKFIKLDVETGGIEWLNDSPTCWPVGLAYDFDNNRIWLIGEGGGLFYYDLSSGEWKPYSVQPPYMPQGAGNRLEYYDGKLYHVRAGGTRELWIINVEG